MMQMEIGTDEETFPSDAENIATERDVDYRKTQLAPPRMTSDAIREQLERGGSTLTTATARRSSAGCMKIARAWNLQDCVGFSISTT